VEAKKVKGAALAALLVLFVSGCTGRGNFSIVCFGDSLTAGEGASPGESWPALLEKKVKAGVFNEGISGETTADALARIEKIFSYSGDAAVIVEFGANDVLSALDAGELFDFEGMASRLSAILEKLSGGGRKVYLVKFYVPEMMDAFPGGDALAPALDKVYDSAAAEYGAEIIGNIWDGIWGNPSLMADDIHPNAAGYRIMADNYFKALAPFLKEKELLR
jgi:lysophospholipase L1-like esterase